MAGSVNKVMLIGHLGADPEIRSFANGGKVANLRLATAESWIDKASGERRERTEWHSVTVQGDGLVRVVETYCKKGSKLYVEGHLQTRKWQDRDGHDRYSTEVVVGVRGQIVLLTPQDKGGGRTADARQPPPSDYARAAGPAPGDDLADDVPF